MKELGIKNIIIGIFIFGAALAFLTFSGAIKIGQPDPAETGNISIWGTLPASAMNPYIDKIKTQKLNVSYTEKNPLLYENELINAFAAGKGPDLFIMNHEGILRHSDKVLELPYASFPRGAYETNYIDEAHLFLTNTGVIAFPLVVDPMITYYNKSLFASAFIVDIPEYWDQVINFSQKITQQMQDGEVTISGVALGTFNNVRHAKAIVSSLFLQNANRIVGANTTTLKKQSTLVLDENLARKSEQSLNFYTSFANISSDVYSWNEAIVDSQEKFVAGELGMYFGRASEVEMIRRKNPNLDFATTFFPQIQGSTDKTTQGAMIGVAISKQTQNVPAAVVVASRVAGKEVIDGLAKELYTAPARKDLLKEKPDDSFLTLVYNSAVISDSWIDPDPGSTEMIFEDLIRSINTGALSVNDALRRAHADLNLVLNRTINLTIPDQY